MPRRGSEAESEESVEAQSRHSKYRFAKKSTLNALKRAKKELEVIVQTLLDERPPQRQPGLMLSWKDVSVALKDSRDDSHQQNRDLRAQIYLYHRLKLDLTSWVNVTRSLNPMGTTWRDTSLLAHPVSRRLGKEWIVQRMFHNTDAVFQQHGFPPWDDDSVDMWSDPEITFTESGLHFKNRRHCVSCHSFEAATALVRQNCLAPLYVQAPPDQTSREVELNTQLCTVVTRGGEFVNILCGEFQQGPDRCTFVMRQINYDDGLAVPTASNRQRCRMTWFDYYRLPGGRTRKRTLSLLTNCQAPGEEFNLDVEAQSLGLSLAGCPDHLKECRLRNHVMAVTTKLLHSIENTLSTSVQKEF